MRITKCFRQWCLLFQSHDDYFEEDNVDYKVITVLEKEMQSRKYPFVSHIQKLKWHHMSNYSKISHLCRNSSTTEYMEMSLL